MSSSAIAEPAATPVAPTEPDLSDEAIVDLAKPVLVDLLVDHLGQDRAAMNVLDDRELIQKIRRLRPQPTAKSPPESSQACRIACTTISPEDVIR